jgi:hypothetical protein
MPDRSDLRPPDRRSGRVKPMSADSAHGRSIGRRPAWRGALRAVALLGVPLLIAGCTHVLLHDERRDKQGQETKKLVAEARIGDTVAALAKSFAEVAELEEARARERAAYLFDAQLRLASRAPSLASKFGEDTPQPNGLLTVVEDRLAKIGLIDGSPEGLRKLRVSALQFTARQLALETTIIEFRGTVGHRFESCEAIFAASADPAAKSETVSNAFLAKLPEDSRALAGLKFPALIEACTKVDQALDDRNRLFAGGEVKRVYGELDQLQRQLLRYELDMKSASEQVNKAAAALRESGAEAAATPAATGKLETVEARAQRVSDLVRVLSAGDEAGGPGAAHAMASERLASLEAVLGAIAGSSTEASVKLSQDDKVAVAVIRGIPALADEADKLLSQASRPRLVPFVAAIDQQKLVLQGFEAARQAKRKQERALRSELEAMLNEASALASVLAPLKRNGDWAQRSVDQLLDELKGEKKIEFLRALAVYADEVKAYRIDSAVWKVRAEAAQYEEGLARSRYATAQWDALIDTIATVLADYHAAGIKQADLAEFFKALGLVSIGVGVAQ